MIELIPIIIYLDLMKDLVHHNNNKILMFLQVFQVI